MGGGHSAPWAAAPEDVLASLKVAGVRREVTVISKAAGYTHTQNRTNYCVSINQDRSIKLQEFQSMNKSSGKEAIEGVKLVEELQVVSSVP